MLIQIRTRQKESEMILKWFQNLGEYHDLYLTSDVFEKFRKLCF